MCEFTKRLIETEYLMTTDYSPKGKIYRQFEAIYIRNNVWLSIQASYGHHCRPQRTIDDLDDYSHWEFALITDKGNFLTVQEVLPNFSSLAEISLYEEGVYSYVPTDLVEELYLALKES